MDKKILYKTRLENYVRQFLNIELHEPDKNGNILTIDGEILDRYDYVEIRLIKPIRLDKTDSIDCLLVFGDGTIELHHSSEKDAYCFLNYKTEIIKQITMQLRCLVKMRIERNAIELINELISNNHNPRHRADTIRANGFEVKRCFVPQYVRIGGMCYMPKLKEYRYIIGTPRLHSPKEVYAVIFK